MKRIKKNNLLIVMCSFLCIINLLLQKNIIYGKYRLPLDSYINLTSTLKNVELKEKECIAQKPVAVEVSFGRCWKELDEETKLFPMRWYILHKENGIAILLSSRIVDYKEYSNLDSKWENSSLREWLNNEFYNYVFDDADKSYIIDYEKTGDKVFILNKEEIEKYFPNEGLVDYGFKSFSVMVDKYLCPLIFPLLPSFEYCINNYARWSDDAEPSIHDIVSIWTRDEELNKPVFCDSQRNFFIADNKKYCGVRPAICVKYDVNANETPIDVAKKNSPIFEFFYDNVPLGGLVVDEVEKFYYKRRD